MKDLKLAGDKSKKSVIKVGDVCLGGKEIVLIGGPCAVESSIQMQKAAAAVRRSGGKILRGGVFKPRTSPYSFQGLGLEGVNYLVQAAREEGLLCVTEVIDLRSLEMVVDKVDLLQIGARNMQNFELLKLAGKVNKPIILKRGLSATIEEWLLAAEYIMAAGNSQVILCERGIRTFEPSTRNTLDLSAVGVAKELSHLPVIVDPSHAAGRRDLIASLSKAAVASGADGLLIEMHPNPEEAMSDGPQSLTPEQFMTLAQDLELVAQSVGRNFVSREMRENLEALRFEIDLIDYTIVERLSKRMQIVSKIGEQKRLDKVKDVGRERDILQRLVPLAEELQLSPEFVKRIYSYVFEFSVQSQIKSKLTGDDQLESLCPMGGK
ncbi:phospho-2-dehydro-3-deoxyheptonate aldolase [Desulfosporosinus acididurans]|uniref:Phospho-2-dehydro-3-deoxyheptonate aldolase n=1 Tax=Desulfosporosinus acididurans TaxID=476652 RepID=A0A0J1ILI0_9FIRM|nr:bifunctional 3-deoxy-7-phosphoheptulonate synthase/chorismate mutase [Desulfosporosinus acididurans]KLU65541.1 phospho-2-dehydro-3-deoxyheptonate aldolase [Desulfosporosinus acididurans]